MPRKRSPAAGLSPTRRFGLILWSSFLLFTAAVTHGADTPDVKALLRRVDRLWRSDSSRAMMTMEVRTAHYERTMTLEAWSQGKEKSLVVIRAPKKDRGVATLKVEANIWNYLPKINRITKIPPSMMMGSWMGSHFTNDDLVKESSYEDDYDPEITFDGPSQGREIYEITLRPKPEAPVVWGRVVMEIEKESLLPLRARYFDEDQALVRTLTFDAPRSFAGRTIPSRLVLRPEDKPAESTVVTYDELEFDLPLPEDLFSLRQLRESE